ncbi:MAG: 3-keto-5-aminohexanoate cleavage protein [Candidatus Bathyarchaeota archaeon]
MEKLIITAAITGSRIPRSKTPYIPITPEEIAQSAYECWEAGASIVHIHVRDPETEIGTQDAELYREVVEPLREKTDLLLCLTTSGVPGLNYSTEKRLTPLQFKPELASLDAGTILLGGRPFINTPEFLEAAARAMREAGVKPELEIFDHGMIATCLRMRNQGLLEEPLHFQFVLGTPHGAPATPRTLIHMVDSIPQDATWSIIGIGRHHLPMSVFALGMGGHIRVGMEDNIYYRRGELVERNSQFVERIAHIAREYGREIASPDEAREILNIPT